MAAAGSHGRAGSGGDVDGVLHLPGRAEVRAADANAVRLGRLVSLLDKNCQLGQAGPGDAGDLSIVDLNLPETFDTGCRLVGIAQDYAHHEVAPSGQSDPAPFW